MNKPLLILFLVISFHGISSEKIDNLELAKIALETKKYDEAIIFLTPLADDGDADAQYYLGDVFRAYDNKKMDLEKAYKWYVLSSKQGNSNAMFKLGLMYGNGEFVEKNYAKRNYWYERAIDKGHTYAKYNMGYSYLNGIGVVQNYQVAKTLFKSAAEENHSLAQERLGSMYREGQGFEKNLLFAHMWFNISASNGNKFAENDRSEIEKFMSEQEIMSAQNLALECVAKDYKNC